MKEASVVIADCTGIDPKEALVLARSRLAGEEPTISADLTEEEAKTFGAVSVTLFPSLKDESHLEWVKRALSEWRQMPGVAYYTVVQSYEDEDESLFSESYIFAGWVPEG